MENDNYSSDAVLNSLGQPVGKPVADWQPRPAPDAVELPGNWVRLEALSPSRHGEALWQANSQDRENRMWTYLPYGPFGEQRMYMEWLESITSGTDTRFYAVVNPSTGQAEGLLAYAAIDGVRGSIELAHLAFSPSLQQTRRATEAVFLMIDHAFALGYRRVEWKCDSLNQPSRRAAQRFGFTYEGLFRQHIVIKGRNRDTCWFSIIHREWPELREAFTHWLAADNFDAAHRQYRALAEFMAGRNDQ